MKHGRLYLYPRSNLDRDWSPFTKGTYDDLKEAGITPEEVMKLQFYDLDGDEHGNPDDLLFDGTAHFIPGRGWCAIIEASTFHWELDERRTQETSKQS